MKNTIDGKFRMQLNLKQNDKKAMGMWDIQELLNELFSMYYKEILLKEILSHLSEGIDPRNIVIFEQDCDPNWLLNKVSVNEPEISLEDNIQISFLYELGFPYGVLPSKKINSIRYIEEVYRALSKFIWYNTKQADGFKTHKLYSSLNIWKDENIDKAIDYLKEMCFKLCRPYTNIKNLKGVIENEIKRFNNDYNSISSNDIHVMNKEILTSGHTVTNIKKRYGSAYTKYLYNKFYDIFSSRDIPLVAIYIPEKNTFNFCGLCAFEKVEDSYFFDLKGYSHHSPSIMELVGEIVGIITLTEYIIRFVKYSIDKYQSSKNQEDLNDLFDFSDEISEEDKISIQQFYEGIKETSAIKDSISKAVKNVFLSDRINGMYDKCIERFEQEMSTFNMGVDRRKKIKIYQNKK